MKTLLIDTNILPDIVQQREPYSAEAAALLAACESGQATGYIAAISFGNAFYILRRSVGSEMAIDSLRRFRQVFDVAPVSGGTVDEALRNPGDDLEDAIQIACAHAVGATAIVSRDDGLKRRSKIAVYTASEMLEQIAAG
jgi:predicted nucleic acid-binding protein